ncbi:iron-sulfur cluster assembly accessory protein [Methylobacterium sp. 4-46]|uniref:HesB/IscA family protein n=1 Tax=unclassified Methylobacterium TaxID=2615210 RepID=UPI000152DCF3|nr:MULTISPECIES: iron-sulfur cluster assembly accessory protein [Methylobacterium]ACA17964.1 iron-sulfur cluster assembly accessory protein [Methylobacterium sp. 4-46]WFT77266.1 iron-sulfur cluster assembly accessory protein [Methylobacterium nodulans]
MISLTDNAVTAVKTALSQAPGTPTGLRIMVEAGGCAGYKYMMGLESSARDGDLVVEQDGVRLFVDGRSQSLVSGLRIDFVTALETSGFVFENPNAGAKCACGKSFG